MSMEVVSDCNIVTYSCIAVTYYTEKQFMRDHTMFLSNFICDDLLWFDYMYMYARFYSS